MSKRGNNEDSIYKDGNRWRGAISLGFDASGKRIRPKVSGKTRAEVVEKLRKVREQVDKGMPVEDKTMSVGAWLDYWVTNVMPGTVADSTLDGYEDTIRLHIQPGLGKKTLVKLTVAEVDALWAAKRKAGYAENSIKGMRSILRKALSKAEAEERVVRNVAALSEPPHPDTDEGRALTTSQAKRLLSEIEKHRLGLVITLALIYGLRRGESLGMRWENFDPKARTMKLTHAVKRVKTRPGDPEYTEGRKTKLTLGPLKTRRSRRTLFLSPELVKLLKAHRKTQDQQQAELEEFGEMWNSHELVFPSEAGTLPDPDNFNRAFAAITNKADLGYWNPHTLRHSGASIMLAQGTPLHVVSEILGHSSIKVTKDIYGHLVEGDKRKASHAMSDALLGGPKTTTRTVTRQARNERRRRPRTSDSGDSD